ncbi:hypothetical protein BH11PSE4_BH11PSE4_25350 [soil metagenome]
MSSAQRIPLSERRYSVAELFELRRGTLLYARSFPVGAERNQHRQIALSLRTLFKNKSWLAAHTADGADAAK